MSVPEGYAQAPTASDHLVKLAVPVKGRDPILIEAPKKAWITPDEVDDYREWLKPYSEAERAILEWNAKNGHLAEDDPARAPFPEEEKKLLDSITLREIKLRWLKPYMKAAEYRLLVTSKKIPELTVEWVSDQLTSEDVSEGESSASTDS